MKESAKVLVVDDDEVVGRSFDRVLSEKGYRVKTVLSGEAALKDMGSEEYDLVFTDIRMPGMNGLEMAKRVKEMNPWLPIVVVTGYGTEENENRAEEIGVADFVRKPLSPEMIERLSERWLKDTGAASESTEAVTAAQPAAEAVPKENVAKNIALFFGAPFIGLAYIVAFPFVGFYLFAKWGMKALGASGKKPANQ